MMRSNVHTHCTWCDGVATPREMAEAALALGFTDLGFSSHAPAPFDPTCPGLADEAAYRADITALREEYAGRLGILCGIEADALRPVRAQDYDYVILSRHYLTGPDGEIYCVDADPANMRRVVEELYGGSAERLAEGYFGAIARDVRQNPPDIVGHCDLITKYNLGNAVFNEEDPGYRRAALAAMDDILNTLAGTGGMVEVNTGAMARGLRPQPYPAPYLLRHMAQRGARPIITTDSHSPATLAYGYDEALALLREAGFAAMAVLRGGEFVDVKL